MNWISSPAVGILMISTFLCGQETDRKEIQSRTLEQLSAEISEGLEVVQNRDFTHRERKQFWWEVLQSWSIREVELYSDGFPDECQSDWYRMIGERWAFLDPEELISQAEGMNAHMKEVLDEAGRGLEGNRAENLASFYWEQLSDVLSGWSRKDPHAAWEAVYKDDGRLSKLILLNRGYGYLAPIILAENLARADPTLVWKKFENFPERKYRNLYRESMLKGISEGLPDNSNWKEILEKAIELSGPDLDQFARVIRENLLARWLEHDPVGAEKWYRSEKAEQISTREDEIHIDRRFFGFSRGEERDRVIKYRKRVSLTPSIVYWMRRDFESSLTWLKERPKMVNELFIQSWEELNYLFTEKRCRKILVVCLKKEDRENLLREMLNEDHHFGSPLEMFVSADDRKVMREATHELKVSAELGEMIVEKIRGEYLWEEKGE